MFEQCIRAFMERAAALLHPDPQMVIVYTHEEDDNIRFQFRFSHNIMLEVKFEVLDYADPYVQGGLVDERKNLGLSKLEDDEHYGENGNFHISLSEDGIGSTITNLFHTAGGWIEYSDVSAWEQRFCLIEGADWELAQAIKEWFENKRQDAAIQRQQRLNR